jgi:NOL1/NOP2/sun family putative RNA methylase
MKIELYEIYRDIYVKPTREASTIALEHGYLPYMIQRYLDILGEKETLELIKAFEKPVKPVVRTNTLVIKDSELKSRLEKLGFKLEEIPWAQGSFWVTEKPNSPTLGATHEYLKGYYYVHRDASSLIPVLLLLHNYSGDVLDACAAPGGKATYMAQILREGEGGIVYANDLVLYRLKALIGHAMRMRLNNIVVLWSDARALSIKLKRKFHRVLLDAPCSGEGRISVDPSRKHKTSILELAILVKREIELLASLVDLLEPGGILAYVTCSIAPEENEYVVNYITRARRDLIVIDPPMRLLNFSKGIVEYRNLKFNEDVEKCIRLWPHRHGLFGYTICLLARRE